MPYKSISEAPANIHELDGAKLTLSQINWLINIYDGIKDNKDIDSPMAVAINRFKNSHQKQGEGWVKKETMSYVGGECICMKDEKGNLTNNFKKEILRVGKWIHPATKKTVEFTKEMLNNMVENFKAAGRKLFVTLDHFDHKDTLNSVGHAEDVYISNDKLYANLNITNKETADKIREGSITLVSPGILREFINTNGQVLKNFIEHIALGENSVIQPQESFVGLNANGNDLIVFQNKAEIPVGCEIHLNNNIIQHEFREVKKMDKIELTQEELNAKLEAARNEGAINLKAEIEAEAKKKEEAGKFMINLKAVKEKEVAFGKDTEEKINKFFAERINLKAADADKEINAMKAEVYEILKSVKETGLVNLKVETGNDNPELDVNKKVETNPGESKEMNELTLKVEKYAKDNKVSFEDAMNCFKSEYQAVLDLEYSGKSH